MASRTTRAAGARCPRRPVGPRRLGLQCSHQWLANRGYAVLNVNYRGSTGFGKNFLNAANGEWSGKMHDDLLDAVNWAVEQKIAHNDKVAIMGGSYGGYATLVGLTYTPDVFACGVDIVGPSSLVTLLKTCRRVLDAVHARDEGPRRRCRHRRGPSSTAEAFAADLVDKIKKPLLIGQGANDPRVKQLEADQIVEAMTEKNIPVTYVLYPDEGHGFHRPENNKSFNAVTEAFLAEQLGGRFEPVGNDFQGSTDHRPRRRRSRSRPPGSAERHFPKLKRNPQNPPVNRNQNKHDARTSCPSAPGSAGGFLRIFLSTIHHLLSDAPSCVPCFPSHNAPYESHVLVLLLVYLYPLG